MRRIVKWTAVILGAVLVLAVVVLAGYLVLNPSAQPDAVALAALQSDGVSHREPGTVAYVCAGLDHSNRRLHPLPRRQSGPSRLCANSQRVRRTRLSGRHPQDAAGPSRTWRKPGRQGHRRVPELYPPGLSEDTL